MVAQPDEGSRPQPGPIPFRQRQPPLEAQTLPVDLACELVQRDRARRERSPRAQGAQRHPALRQALAAKPHPLRRERDFPARRRRRPVERHAERRPLQLQAGQFGQLVPPRRVRPGRQPQRPPAVGAGRPAARRAGPPPPRHAALPAQQAFPALPRLERGKNEAVLRRPHLAPRPKIGRPRPAPGQIETTPALEKSFRPRTRLQFQRPHRDIGPGRTGPPVRQPARIQIPDLQGRRSASFPGDPQTPGFVAGRGRGGQMQAQPPLALVPAAPGETLRLQPNPVGPLPRQPAQQPAGQIPGEPPGQLRPAALGLYLEFLHLRARTRRVQPHRVGRPARIGRRRNRDHALVVELRPDPAASRLEADRAQLHPRGQPRAEPAADQLRHHFRLRDPRLFDVDQASARLHPAAVRQGQPRDLHPRFTDVGLALQLQRQTPQFPPRTVRHLARPDHARPGARPADPARPSLSPAAHPPRAQGLQVRLPIEFRPVLRRPTVAGAPLQGPAQTRPRLRRRERQAFHSESIRRDLAGQIHPHRRITRRQRLGRGHHLQRHAFALLAQSKPPAQIPIRRAQAQARRRDGPVLAPDAQTRRPPRPGRELRRQRRTVVPPGQVPVDAFAPERQPRLRARVRRVHHQRARLHRPLEFERPAPALEPSREPVVGDFQIRKT